LVRQRPIHYRKQGIEDHFFNALFSIADTADQPSTFNSSKVFPFNPDA